MTPASANDEGRVEKFMVGRRLLAIGFLSWLMMVSCGLQVTSAQASGSISGTIKDPSGGVIPGATVTLTNTAFRTQFRVTSNIQGVFSFPNVPVGRYDLTITLERFKPVKRTGLAVDINSRLQVDATLELGEQSEEVTVSANRPTVFSSMAVMSRGG